MIIEFLSKCRFATREQILSHLKISSGGRISELLTDLELCGFIKKYTPYNLNESSKLSRFCINDPYLQFYFKFIAPHATAISQGKYNKNHSTGINQASYYQWLGFMFERFCRANSHCIASILGFSAVNYQSGAFYSRKTIETDPALPQ